ncbi:MAG: PDZ domain-containing protein [Dokdonella sp.]
MKVLLLVLLIVVSPLAWSAERSSPSSTATAGSTKTADKVDQAAARQEMTDLQKQLGELSRRMAELSMKMRGDSPQLTALRYLGSPDRAMIGVLLSEAPNGVRVGGVTPDGPAARAGLKTGDVITRVSDQDIAGKKPADALENTRGLLGDLKEGEVVKLGYRRDGKSAVATITADRRQAATSYRLLTDGDEGIELGDMDRDVDDIARGAAGAMPWWGIQLAELNPDLGRYFGTDHGVLVLSTDGDALAGVKSGDVIQQIADSKVDRPEQALRKLRDQPTDSKVPMQVLREHKAMTLSVSVPDYKSVFDIVPPPPPPPPPAPPAPEMPNAPPPPAPPAAPMAASMPPPPAAPLAPVDARDAIKATIAAVVADPKLQTRMVSPGVAAEGGRIGSPGLWAGKIVEVRSSDAGTCYVVVAATIGKGGKPIRNFSYGPTFSACTTGALDKSRFYPGRYATFLGTVTGPAEQRLGRAGRPTIAVTDAQEWSPLPDMSWGLQTAPLPPR